jgi:hypothetical protein
MEASSADICHFPWIFFPWPRFRHYLSIHWNVHHWSSEPVQWISHSFVYLVLNFGNHPAVKVDKPWKFRSGVAEDCFLLGRLRQWVADWRRFEALYGYHLQGSDVQEEIHSFWTPRPLKMSPRLRLETSGPEHPSTQRRMPEEQYHQV